MDSNIVLGGKVEINFFCVFFSCSIYYFQKHYVIFWEKVHFFSNQTLLFGLMLKILVKKVFFCTIRFYCSLVNRKEKCCKQDQI